MHQGNLPFNGRLAVNAKGQADADNFIDLEQLLAIARRQAKTVAIVAAIGLMLGIVSLIFSTPYYTAGTSILLDDNLGKLADEPSPMPANAQTDATILSQIAILKSTELAAKVVDRENLTENEIFMNPPRSLFSRVKSMAESVIGMFAGGEKKAGSGNGSGGPRMYAASILQSNLNVERQGRSFVIDLNYTSNDPELAGRIARAYADVYLSDQLDANFDATQRATVWLQGRLTELKASSQKAALEVERYRAENGLTAAKGTLVSEQQLSDLNSQFILTQAETARALAQYNQYKSIVDGGPEAAVNNAAVLSDQLNASVISPLRTRYLTISKRLQEITSRYGEDHPQAVSLRTEQQEVGRQIFQELKQATASLRNQYEVAKSRETSLRESLQKVTGETSTANQSLVHLRELEQKSQALSDLYQTYLKRYQEAVQQQSFPIAKARIISVASKPTDPSSPKKKMILAASLLLGLFAGAGIGAWREFRERFFRVGEEVRNVLGVKFLGYLPAISGSGDIASRGSSDGQGPAPRVTNMMRVAIDSPASAFAETLRNAKVAADVVLQGRESKVIGIISALPDEGKSTVAANFAGLLAANGAKTLLIDGDLRNPGLTRALSLAPQKGLVEVVVGEVPWQSAIKIDSKTKLAILPAVVPRHLSHTSELISCAGMSAFLDEARGVFEYIIVDLPPLGPVVDSKAFAPLADGFVMVTEWGVTPRPLVKSMLQSENLITPKILGLILNKADMKRLAKYSAYGSSEHFLDRYSSYYLDEASGKS
ncbi:Wzz/FepE/Etk N-terminal domain-containing protein [Mesorhizobium sp. RMAD-H1]|uniref:Wzz/FepE/Etk N-terminal domain-containing protein n=1 Tax=Mesorhizobium sp. RMAD-H1 TaxID=2587065 RepID=UPI0016223F6B|nr:Wzz/FepE/Etk N-terminal domain-containing protein [Mesorhizobium sp. RMAD-H1]MBB2971350.1 succinoglycan biosynthesis transport protein ExoP [Mesorhizobium sp. RMAD-H1]